MLYINLLLPAEAKARRQRATIAEGAIVVRSQGSDYCRVTDTEGLYVLYSNLLLPAEAKARRQRATIAEGAIAVRSQGRDYCRVTDTEGLYTQAISVSRR